MVQPNTTVPPPQLLLVPTGVLRNRKVPGRVKIGYWIHDDNDQGLRSNSPLLVELGVLIVPVVGVTFTDNAYRDEAFAPGHRLVLIPEPTNASDPHAVGVWDETRSKKAGYVPKIQAPKVAAALQHAPGLAAMTLMEIRKRLKGSGPRPVRTGLRILVAPPAVFDSMVVVVPRKGAVGGS